MRILVLDANYPHDDNLYGDVFVHVRVLRYMALGHEVRAVAFFTDKPSYEFDGVRVTCAPDLAALKAAIADFNADVILIHFFQGWMLDKIIAGASAPVVIWVHGVEALGWYRRLFNLRLSREFAEYVFYNTVQMWRLRRLFAFARRNPGKVEFVFVSDWMRRVAESDTFSSAPAWSVVPNPIDTARFVYCEKSENLRHQVLLIRSFDSRKYATDIAIDAILKLSRLPEFGQFRFSIHGKGKMFDSQTKPLSGMPNVTLREGFLTHEEIVGLHATHGVMLCPTRQDAQGVSMCEAMASGLVPVASRSTAIPEFVSDGVSGFLTDGPEGIVEALLKLHREPELFRTMSQSAAAEIRNKAAIEHVVDAEIDVMQRLAVPVS